MKHFYPKCGLIEEDIDHLFQGMRMR